MKKVILYISLIAFLLITLSATTDSVCDVRVLKNELLKELRPDYKYDSSNINRFILESKRQGTEVQVPLFSGEKYRLLFNTAGLSTDFEIKIYDKKNGASNRNLLFSASNNQTGQNIFVYEPENPKTIYIDYILPGVEEEGITGCIVFLMGYKIG